MAKVYIEYSRKDKEFTRRLATALEKNGLDCWVDWEDIPPSVDWWKEIEKGIEEADAYIFLLSPDSLLSKVVHEGLNIAVKNGKQIIPVVVRNIDKNDVIPSQIAMRNWIYMRESDDFDRGVNTIMEAINTDYEWLAAHRGLQVKALEWERNNKDESFLLRGKALQDAELQLSMNASKDPQLTNIQREYIQSSQKGAASILSRGVEFINSAIGSRNSEPNSEIKKVVPNAQVSQSTPDASVAAQNIEAEPQSKETPALTAEQIAERAARLQIAMAANMLANNRSQAVFNDKAEGEDQLGIRDEVEALAETLLLRDVEPPVAVGILGGWGSGKSFVMYLISQYVQSTRAKPVKKGWGDKDKEKDPDVPAFVGHIYQINFNAWTYAKSNLWASLMDTIFSSLNRQMQLERLLAHREYSSKDNPPSKADIKAKMLAGDDEFKKIYLETPQIDQVKGLEKWKENLAYWGQRLLKDTLLWNVMRGQQVETLDKLKDTEEQLLQLKNRREKFEEEDHAPNEIVANDLDNTGRLAYLQSIKNFTLAFLSDALSKTAKEELKKQDVTDEDVQKFLKEATGFRGGLKTIIAAFRRSKLYLLWAIIFLVLSIFLPRFWAAYAEKPVQYYIAQGVTIFLTILPVAKVLYSWAIKFVNLSQEANKILEGSFAAQQAKHAEKIISSTDMSLPKKVAELQVDISKGSLAAYDALIGLLEAQAVEQRQKIGSSAKYSNLMEFVQSRLDAATYENQLGLMHQVRKDIDELTFSLVDNADEDIFPRGKPRVILYIDDLDRCPPPRVVEVLEAVQLLLSTKLFIVILGLDTRYVTRALEKEYKEILQHEGDPSGLDYIEKIIQIPYRVRSIEPKSLRKYIEKQMDIEKADEPPTGQVPTDILKPGVVKTKPKEEIKSTPQSDPKPQDHKPLEVDLPAAVIQFKQEDLDDLAACCQKIPLTPRSIKRLVNVFKLMKIFWFRADKNAGLAERDRPRSVKQAAICLLALSSAYPEVMREVFVHLDTLYREGQEQTELFTALNNIKLPPGSAHDLSWQLRKYKTDLGILNTIAGVEQKKFGQVTLQELKASTFNIVRSFSFVGDPLYWTDGEEETAKPKGLEEKNVSA